MRAPLRNLEGEHLRLEPTVPAHHAGLFESAAGPQTFRYFLTWPREWTLGAFSAWMEGGMDGPSRVCYTVLERETGRVVGSSSFLDLQPTHRGVEVGATWFHPDARGTRVNPETKLLMLGHAFDEMGCVRVQLKCDARNLRSQAAIAKLGAVREGVLRKHRILQDGHVRDTVMYSITREEWPDVRARLLERLSSSSR